MKGGMEIMEIKILQKRKNEKLILTFDEVEVEFLRCIKSWADEDKCWTPDMLNFFKDLGHSIKRFQNNEDGN